VLNFITLCLFIQKLYNKNQGSHNYDSPCSISESIGLCETFNLNHGTINIYTAPSVHLMYYRYTECTLSVHVYMYRDSRPPYRECMRVYLPGKRRSTEQEAAVETTASTEWIHCWPYLSRHLTACHVISTFPQYQSVINSARTVGVNHQWWNAQCWSLEEVNDWYRSTMYNKPLSWYGPIVVKVAIR